MTAMFDALDAAPAGVVYFACAVVLVVIAVAEHVAVRDVP